jgi:murein DD-endopeptidase MepM/ murein hydrolase activator NlpD
MSIVDRKLLKRRIERMLGKIPNQFKWPIHLGVAVVISGLMVFISCASRGVVQDWRITNAQAVAMAERAGKDKSYPIVVNDLVLKELNAYLGTPEGRAFMKASLERMKNYRNIIVPKIKEYGVPTEFLAIPLVESGYRNLEQKEWWGAGLWMFIESTARAFGLTVNEEVDERLDVDILTDAAMRYLLANKLRFNDWQLSVLAYNVGESNVQKAIERIDSRDVWELSREFYKEGSNYYAQFMAAAIILKNPDMVAHKLELFSEDREIKFINPIAGWISSRFGNRKSPFSKREEFHTGIDISARKGSVIHAAASGTVTKVAFTEARGHQITIQHGSNYQTHYAQCEKILAEEGQVVRSGEPIATCGSSGRSTGPHLHFELRKNGEPINPETYIVFR